MVKEVSFDLRPILQLLALRVLFTKNILYGGANLEEYGLYYLDVEY